MMEDYKKDLEANKYQESASRTINKHISQVDQELHAVFGMAGEVGELQSLYQKEYQGHPFDIDHAKKELGDLLWFVAEYCTICGWSLEDVMKQNIEKNTK